MHDNRSRALGALYGLALGDALGMPTQSLPRAEIVARYGAVISGFHPGADGHPLAAGLPAGSVTDDTEQAVLLARLVVAGGGEVDAAALARDPRLLEDRVVAASRLTHNTGVALAGAAAVAAAVSAGIDGDPLPVAIGRAMAAAASAASRGH